LKTVLFALDSWLINSSKDKLVFGDSYPLFMYDNNPFNDVEYLLNKEVLFSNTLNVLTYTRQGNVTTSFDDYDHWRDMDFGWDVTLSNYARPEKSTEVIPYTQDDILQLEGVLEEKFLPFIRSHPDITFYIYFPPYSAIFWDDCNQRNLMEKNVMKLQVTAMHLLEEENVRLYSFHDDYEITANLDNYRDDCHHTAEINSRILTAISNGEHQLTRENNAAHWDGIRAYYAAFDFESLFSR